MGWGGVLGFLSIDDGLNGTWILIQIKDSG